MAERGPLGLRPSEKGGVFFLFGEDEFRKDEAARGLVDWHLDPATRDFNFDPLSGSETTVERLASVLATPPMMAESRVVLVRETEAFAGSPKARKVLLETAENPPPGLAAILVATIPRSSTAKFYSELKKKARAVEFQPIRLDEMPAWLVEWTPGRHGSKISEEAARSLVAGLGGDIGVLDQELGKLSQLVGEGGTITADVVKEAGTWIPEENRWAWLDRVGNRQLRDALAGLDLLISQGESGVSLTMGLATHLLRLGIVRAGGPQALGRALPPHQRFLAKRLQAQARNWTVEELENALLGLRRVDRLLKSSALPDQRILEEWLLSLALVGGTVPA